MYSSFPMTIPSQSIRSYHVFIIPDDHSLTRRLAVHGAEDWGLSEREALSLLALGAEFFDSVILVLDEAVQSRYLSFQPFDSLCRCLALVLKHKESWVPVSKSTLYTHLYI